LDLTGGWRKLQDEELRNFYFSPTIVTVTKSKTVRMAEHVARVGEQRKAYKISVVTFECKRPFRRHWQRREDNIKMDLI